MKAEVRFDEGWIALLEGDEELGFLAIRPEWSTKEVIQTAMDFLVEDQ